MMSSRETGLQNIAGRNRGGRKTNQHFPSHSRITRGGADQHSSCTSMQESNHGPTLGITHLHRELLPHEARNLSNQVLCMIAEYHLTSMAQGLMSLSPVFPEMVRDLLPSIEDYVVGGTFQETRDMWVVDRAKTLRIATWLHHLDMSAEGDGMASQTLEVQRHGRGPLVDLLLAPVTSHPTFAEVVECVLNENWHRAESLLDDLWGHHAQI